MVTSLWRTVSGGQEVISAWRGTNEMPKFCAVYGCSNRSNREKNKSYFRVPKAVTHKGETFKKLTEKRRQTWIKNLNLKSGGAESVHARVCSDHFVKGCPSAVGNINSEDWAPTVNLGYQLVKPVTEESIQNEERLRSKKLHETCTNAAETLRDPGEGFRSPESEHFKDPELRSIWLKATGREEGPNFNVERCSTYVCSHSNKCQGSPCEGVLVEAAAKAVALDHNYVSTTPAGALDETLDYSQDLEARLGKVALPSRALFSRYCASDDQIRFYTKFPSDGIFRVFWESIAPSASQLVYWTKAMKAGEEACPETSPLCSMPLIDEFLMYSMRVSAGMMEQLIADMFNVSIATVSRVTITWANYLFIMLSSLPIWISREKVKSSMPLKFKNHCPSVRVILGCTEIATATASSLDLKSETVSNYTNRMTLKGLIGVAPCGLVTFISPLYTGCISNKEITRISGVLSLLEPGDYVMADKGFLIQDLLADVEARLIIPPFKHSVWFKKEETEQAQAITRPQTIVERVIATVKSFHIWDSPVPPTLVGCVNQIWNNCCILANFQGPLCFDE